MANSYQIAVSDGTLVLLDISFGYLDRANISVYYNGVLNTTNWSWVGPTSHTLAFSPAVPAGVQVRVQRKTDASALRHDFSTGAAFNAQTLDEDLLQSLYTGQEASETSVSGDFFTDINMHSFRLFNLGTATSDQDALTLGQARADGTTATGAAVAAAASAAAAAVSVNVLRTDLATASTVKGAALSAYLAPWTGVNASTVQVQLNTILHMKNFVTDLTGATDVSDQFHAAFVQARIQSGQAITLIVNKGTYKITKAAAAPAGTAIGCGSWMRVIFEPGVVIDATGLPNETTSLFSIAGQDKVYFEGNGAALNGARATANPVIEGNSAAFFLYNSTNVCIKDFNISGFATDGITVTGDTASDACCENVRIEGCNADNNRRNGMSIIACKGCVVLGGKYSNSNGAPSGPWAGIDVEPNTGVHTTGIELLGVRTQGNSGPGLLFVPSAQAGNAGTYYDVTVLGWNSDTDGLAGSDITGKPALLFAAGGTWANPVYGQIVCRDFVIRNPKWAGIGQQNWDAANAPQVICENGRVYNPDSTLTSTNNTGRSGLGLYIRSTDAVQNCGKMKFINIHCEDNRGSVRMTGGHYVDVGASTGTWTDVHWRNCKSVNFTGALKFDVNFNVLAASGTAVNCSIEYDTQIQRTALPTASIGAWLGTLFTASSASRTYTLPLLAKSVNCRYHGYFPFASCTVTAQTGETIKPTGVAAALTHLPASGDCWTYWNPDGLAWIALPGIVRA